MLNPFQRFFTEFMKRRQRFRRLLGARRVRSLRMEPLEGRALLASVAWDSAGDLIYQPNALADRIPDFSNVGYYGGVVGRPNVATKVTVAPGAGDDTALVQAAIDQVEALPLGADGFRGAVLLTAGEYQISGQLTIQASGVVLRGVGDSLTGTVLRATGTTQRTLVKATGSGARVTVSGTTRNFADKYVPVGARSFQVDSTAGLSVGETVIINRPTTAEWINVIGMNLLDIPWTPGNLEQSWDRVITRVEGNVITVDAPLTNSIDLNYGGGTIKQYTWAGRLNNIGVESLRGISDFVSATDPNHSTWFIEMSSLQNGWVRDITAENFRQGLVTVTRNSKWVTVEDNANLTPKSVITGGERYTYNIDGQLVLVQNCYASEGRHDYVLGAAVPGPNVFVNNIAVNTFSDIGPHHRYSTGALFDNIASDGQINVQNRGNLGTGHGWAGANMVIWNSTAPSFVVQNPPTAQNWLIGSTGSIAQGTFYVGPHDPGTVESHGVAVQPRSLYQAQLQERLEYPNLDYREYWVGDIDNFYSIGGTGNTAPVDTTWQSQFDAATTVPLSNFDNLSNPQAIPFTLNFPLASGEQIVGATLSLGLRATSSDVSGNRIYIDSLTDNPTFASLGWSDIATTGTTSKVLNLASRLSLLQDGRLNLGILQNTAIDWVVLNLQVAPAISLKSWSVPPVADAMVQGGINANQNYGTVTTLSIKEDNSADFDRRAFLRFDLGAIQGEVLRATIKLVPTSVGATLENRISFVTSNTWSETGVTWNNQPSAVSFASSIVRTGNPYEILVTPLVQQALDTGDLLSLRVDSTMNVGGAAGIVSYGSRENASSNLRPVLIIETKAASVANRRVFYNRSTSTVFGNGSGNPTNSIDSTKTALLPGQTTSFANYTNYSRGLNGIVIDIADLAGTPTAADFSFAVWNGVSSTGFSASTGTPTISVIPSGGTGGSSRVKIEFADNAIRNTWLRVTVLATANTGLVTNDVFYFGNAIGDFNVGNSGTPTIVRSDASDSTAVRKNLSPGANTVGVTNVFDINKDGRVNAIDMGLVRQNQQDRLIRFFTAPVSLRLTGTLLNQSVAKINGASQSKLLTEFRYPLESDLSERTK